MEKSVRIIDCGQGGAHTSLKSVCFINGCSYSVPHPIRYRVDHQCEQLRFDGIRADRYDEWDITPDVFERTNFDNLIVFRAPMTKRLGRIIDLAQQHKVRVLFDVDDLVIDTRYTSKIQHVKEMSSLKRRRYDRGVDLMRETMMRCDGVLTSTSGMADELRRYVAQVVINRNVASAEMVYWSEMALAQKGKHEGVRLGYFSGSITHNEDFELILPAIARILRENKDTLLYLVGELDLPQDLTPYKDRIFFLPFVSWRSLPFLLASVDINLAPLVDTVFNRAKSENKWVEAALVGVPTIASNVGAFKEMIIDGKTGALCSGADGWYEALDSYIGNQSLRDHIGRQARRYCLSHCTTKVTANTLKSKLAL